MIKPKVRAIIIYAMLTFGLVYTTVQAQTPTPPVAIVLPAGASVVVSCASDTLTVETTSATSRRISCASVAATGTPVPTSTSLVPTVTSTRTPTVVATATPTPMPDHSNMGWHAPGGHSGIPNHEHGSMPPQWLLDAGYTPMFTHAANTPNENSIPFKHSAHKGFAMRLKGVDIYLILHWDLNPSGHVSRFHSYQAWFRDGTGAVSHMNGWLDFATNANDTGPNLVLICGINSNERPIMQVNRGDCPAGTPLIDEVWYPRAGSSGNWSIDLGMNSPSNYYAGGDPNDPATWTPLNGFASNNLRRRVEVAWYADRSNLRGDFWTTQWGDVVSGPTDALCDGLHTRTYGTKTYTVLCLKQTIQPSLTPIVFPSNSFQTTYPGGSGSSRVQLPN